MEFKYLIFLAAISVFLFSSIFDFKYLKIPNWNIILLFILGIIYQFSLDKELIDIFVYLICILISIIFGFFLFVFGIWGGGDAKLISVSIFFLDIMTIPYFITGSFICGLLWGFVFFLCRNKEIKRLKISEFLKTRIPFAPGILSSLVFVNVIFS
jgi:Flp pilus assembly protein protease CpaA